MYPNLHEHHIFDTIFTYTTISISTLNYYYYYYNKNNNATASEYIYVTKSLFFFLVYLAPYLSITKNAFHIQSINSTPPTKDTHKKQIDL